MFACGLLNHAYAFLDETTSALDANDEDCLFKALVSAKITVISVENPPAL